MKDTPKQTNDTASAYWAVRYGGMVRVTSFRVSTGAAAAKATFGLVAHDMAVKRLTPRKVELQRARFLDDALAAREGWHLIPDDALPSDLERGARVRARTYIDDKGWPQRRDVNDELYLDRGGDREGRAPTTPPAPKNKIVGCSNRDCGANVIRMERTGEPDVILNVTFPLSMHTCGVPAEGVELLMLPAEIVNIVHDHTTFERVDRAAGEKQLYAFHLDDYSALATKLRALIVRA